MAVGKNPAGRHNRFSYIRGLICQISCRTRPRAKVEQPYMAWHVSLCFWRRTGDSKYSTTLAGDCRLHVNHTCLWCYVASVIDFTVARCITGNIYFNFTINHDHRWSFICFAASSVWYNWLCCEKQRIIQSHGASKLDDGSSNDDSMIPSVSEFYWLIT